MALTESSFNDSMSGQGVLCRPRQFLSLIILSFGDLLVKKSRIKVQFQHLCSINFTFCHVAYMNQFLSIAVPSASC